MKQPKANYPKAYNPVVGDLLLDGDVIYRLARFDGSDTVLTNMKDESEVRRSAFAVGRMTAICAGAVVQTGAEPHRILEVSDKGYITFTGTNGEQQGMPALLYADTLAALRARVRIGKWTPEQRDEPDVVRQVRAVLDSLPRAVRVHLGMINSDADPARAAVILNHDGKLRDDMLPRTLTVIDQGSTWIAVKLNPAPDADDTSELDTELIEAIDAAAEDLTSDAEVDAAIEAGTIDLDAPLEGEDEDAELPEYRKGDRLHAANGKDYTVIAVEGEWLRLKHAHGETYHKIADIPALLHAEAQPDWGDEVVRLSAELIEVKRHRDELLADIEAMREMLTDPLERKVETLRIIQCGSNNNHNLHAHDEEIQQLLNEGWYCVHEQEVVLHFDDNTSRCDTILRFERPVRDTGDDGGVVAQAEAHLSARQPDSIINVTPEAQATYAGLLYAHGLDATMILLDQEAFNAGHAAITAHRQLNPKRDTTELPRLNGGAS